jgi:ribosomal protein S27E
MPIPVKCGSCDHEITVSDAMAGKKGRCPECDAILSIPSPKGGTKRRKAPRTATPAPAATYGKLSFLGGMMSFLGLVSLLGLAGSGVFTGVSAIRFPESFVCPLGLFDSLSGAVASQPILMGLGFAVGGILLGALFFLVLNAAGQAFLVLISIERSLREIAGGLGSHRD